MNTQYPHISLGILRKQDDFGKFAIHINDEITLTHISTRELAEEIMNDYMNLNKIGESK